MSKQLVGSFGGLPGRASSECLKRAGSSSFLGKLEAILASVGDIEIQVGQKQKDFYTVDEVAALARRSPYTVRTWIKDGLITATRVTGTGPRGRLLIARAELSKITHAGLGAQIPAGAAD